MASEGPILYMADMQVTTPSANSCASRAVAQEGRQHSQEILCSPGPFTKSCMNKYSLDLRASVSHKDLWHLQCIHLLGRTGTFRCHPMLLLKQ